MDPDLYLERFRLEHLLHQREQVSTWAAIDTQTEAAVIIKRLDLSALEDWRVQERFQREADALRTLQHERLPRLLLYKERPEEQEIALVMTRLPGVTLRERMNAGWKVSEGTARRLAEQALDILNLLHTADPPLIHRDIKPENLIIDERDQLYLIDLGAVQQEVSGQYTAVGSFQYMAPEQLQGYAVPASDQYGLGITFIELLSGSDLQQIPRQGLYFQLKAALHVSEGFCNWLEHLVAPYPEQRFESVSMARQALQAPQYLESVKIERTVRAQHDKQTLTPFLWLVETPDAVSLEIRAPGSTARHTLSTFFRYGLSCQFHLVGLMLFAVMLPQVFIAITGVKGFSFLFFVNVPLYFVGFAWLKRQLQGVESAQQKLTLKGQTLIHSYQASTKDVLFASTRQAYTVKVEQERIEKHYPLADVDKLILRKGQIRVKSKQWWNPSLTVLTLRVDFPLEARQTAAAAFEQRGLLVDV